MAKMIRKSLLRGDIIYSYITFSMIILSNLSLAKDLGQHGQTFLIIETDPIEDIQDKISILEKSGEIDLKNQEIANTTKNRINRPKLLESIVHTEEARILYYDPTIVYNYDITDHTGNVFYRAGTKVNPLDTISLSYKLYFIDGDSRDQVELAIGSLKENRNNIIILTKGSPIELSKKYKQDIYFDQGGTYTSKLGITQVPAIVSQEGSRLMIKEIKLKYTRSDKSDEN
ncbi:MAG: type-F conjugative transfer system protein TraW [Rickettsiales bacterium]|nr:MAG: type-F conjugative transfer system protein TraW [Rickettsiales bacterium]